MKVSPHIDELLCGFIDGELSLRQQTEVQRLVTRDPDVAQRLQQLRNCRTLVNVLPRAEAPGDLLEQVKLTLERRSLLEERPILTDTRAGVRHLRIRRFMAAAAMIALVGALGAVVYQIVAPIGPAEKPQSQWAKSPQNVPDAQLQTRAAVATMVADAGFSGRLELSTASFSQADGFIRAAAEDNGLAAEPSPSEQRVVYRVTGSRDAMGRFLADLDTIGQNFKTARLIVDTEHFGDPVIINSVTLPQVARVMDQNTAVARVQAARDLAVLNSFAREMPGREIQMAMAERLNSTAAALSSIPRPRLASQDRKYPTRSTPLEGEAKVKASLTIVLLSAQ